MLLLASPLLAALERLLAVLLALLVVLLLALLLLVLLLALLLRLSGLPCTRVATLAISQRSAAGRAMPALLRTT